MYPVLELGPISFYTFGLAFGSAVCLGAYLFLRYFRTHQLPVKPTVLVVLLATAGFAGAKLDSALVLTQHILHGRPFQTSVVEFFSSGYTYLGCVLTGCLAGAFYVHINRLPWLRMYDSIFCIGPAYALGRVGCFLAGDGDYGTPSSLPWAVAFPHGIIPTLARVHPTMLYSAAWELLVFAILTRIDHRQPRPGTLLGLYLAATGTGRFLIEFLGRNPILTLHMTEAQLVSLALIVIGMVVLLSVQLTNHEAQIEPIPVAVFHADHSINGSPDLSLLA